jgi:hypothetical protein
MPDLSIIDTPNLQQVTDFYAKIQRFCTKFLSILARQWLSFEKLCGETSKDSGVDFRYIIWQRCVMF